jgi:hypothetical protein
MMQRDRKREGLRVFRAALFSVSVREYREILAGRWADIVDMLTMHPETRRNVVRLLGEIDAHR